MRPTHPLPAKQRGPTKPSLILHTALTGFPQGLSSFAEMSSAISCSRKPSRAAVPSAASRPGNLITDEFSYRIPKCRDRFSQGITAKDMRLYRWVTPTLTARIRYLEWTRGGAVEGGEVCGADREGGEC